MTQSHPGSHIARRRGVPRRGALLLSAAALAGLALPAVWSARAQGTANETRPAGLTARRAGAGKLNAPMAVAWKFTGNYFPNNPAAPVLAGDTIYFSMGNRVYAVDAQSGAEKWRYPTDTFLSTFMQTTPVVKDGKLLFGAGDGLYALDANTGKLLWHFFLRGSVNVSPVVSNGTVYFGADNGRFYAINAQTGEALGGPWSPNGRPGVEIGTSISAEPALLNDTLYYVTSDGVLHAAALSSITRRWAQRLGGNLRFPPVLNGELIYLAFDSTLATFRQSVGQPRWTVPLPASAVAAPAVDDEGNAYVATVDRYIYAVDARGRGLWKQPPRVDHEVLSAPVVAGNLLIVTTALGGVYAYDTASGALVWNYSIKPSGITNELVPIQTNVVASPIVSDGALYVLTDDGTLTAFRTDAPDGLPPIIRPVDPEPGDYLNGRPPFRIAARITDEGSGINRETISLKLDGTAIPRRVQNGSLSTQKPGYVYDPADDTLEYLILEGSDGKSNMLADGHHTVTISVQDWKGNTATRSWTFYTDDTLRKRSRMPGQQRPGQRPGGLPGGGGRGGRGGAGGAGGAERG